MTEAQDLVNGRVASSASKRFGEHDGRNDDLCAFQPSGMEYVPGVTIASSKRDDCAGIED